MDLQQTMDFALLQGLLRIRPHTYAGVRLQCLESEFGVTPPGTHMPDGIPGPSSGFASTSAAVGLRGRFDTRDSSFPARTGSYVDLGVDICDDL